MIHLADDRPKWTEEYKVLTREQLQIPALHMIGCADFRKASSRLDVHYHCNMEFVVVIEGKQQYMVDGRQYMLYGGDVFMTYPYESHGNGDIPQEVCEFIWFQIDLSTAENFLGLAKPRSEILFRLLQNYRHRVRKAGRRELNGLCRAFELLASEAPQEQIQGYSCLLHFLMNTICIGDTLPVHDIYSPDIQDAISFIHKNLTENLNIEEIADCCALSPSRFKAKFREQLGITPHAYITSLKIDTAKVLLKDPGNTVTDVAYRLNFASSNHFAAVFKKYTGYTPSWFRRHRYSAIY